MYVYKDYSKTTLQPPKYLDKCNFEERKLHEESIRLMTIDNIPEKTITTNVNTANQFFLVLSVLPHDYCHTYIHACNSTTAGKRKRVRSNGI